jgi:hypothetical protein
MAVPAISNLYTASSTDITQYACRTIPNQGSKIGVIPLDKCDKQAPALSLSTTAVALNGTTMTITLASIGGVTATATDKRTIMKGTNLYFGPAGAPTTKVKVNQTVELVGASGTAVSVDPAPAAIAITDIALTYGLLRLYSWEDLSFNITDTTVDTTDGESIFESMSAVSRALVIPLAYRVTDDNLAHQRGLHAAGRRGQNLFVAIARNGFPPIGGEFAFFSPQAAGAIKTNAKVSGTLQSQGEFYYPPYRSEMVAASAELTTYDKFLQYCGF